MKHVAMEYLFSRNRRGGVLTSSLYETMKSTFMNFDEKDFDELMGFIHDNPRLEVKEGFILINRRG